ncbi:endospore germination permease [Oceanobacillus sp. 143]|uniref:Spore gernimation protein n=1 Tax=Oceanobacillus zhaokaii TaxID=2052660 RepID=A0A345PDR0_9BACI|nr:endospore germination permease [Oceanobacillus zhaokaii]AXI08140.1 spore gernimation protein [Oceanobacillus zhaokaii]QGS68088.1 endospore germination permease [Oceanobacillus sp. 143]
MKLMGNSEVQISEKDIAIAVPSIVIAVGILSLPAKLANVTISSDGWIPLLVSGMIMIIVTWLFVKVASRFPNQSFFAFGSKLVTKPIAIVLIFLFAIQGILVTAFEVREIADISQIYLLNDTPMEVLSLSFLLVVIYAVSGERAGIFRLNMLFFPFIIFISFFVIILSIGWIQPENLLPVFQTSLSGYMEGVKTSINFYGNIGFLLFYIALAKQPKKAPKMAAIGMTFVVVLYTLLFIACVGVMGNGATTNLIYPTIDLAKELEIPGGFFERFDSVFFTIWVMAIFNTAVIALDVAVLALQSVFKKLKKQTIIFMLAPLAYFIGLLPKDYVEVSTLALFTTYYALILIFFVTLLFTIMSKIKGVK